RFTKKMSDRPRPPRKSRSSASSEEGGGVLVAGGPAAAVAGNGEGDAALGCGAVVGGPPVAGSVCRTPPGGLLGVGVIDLLRLCRFFLPIPKTCCALSSARAPSCPVDNRFFSRHFPLPVILRHVCYFFELTDYFSDVKHSLVGTDCLDCG